MLMKIKFLRHETPKRLIDNRVFQEAQIAHIRENINYSLMRIPVCLSAILFMGI